jgi:nucleotide sugar dehydrogenase
MKNQRISIFGLGYVGLTNAACFAAKGHKVIGVDVKSWKVNELNQGESPVTEEGLGYRIEEAVRRGLLSATTDVKTAILNSEISLICVGTPSNSSGGIDLTSISRLGEDIGMSLRDKNDYHLVVVRSTVIPGTTERTVIPTLEKASQKKGSVHFGVCMNPEFLREGTMVEDFMNPEIIVVGEFDKRSGDLLEEIYSDFNARIIRADIKTAEMAKYVFNAFHAVKTSFINEIGNMCQAHGIDTHVISEILCSDHKLNISPKYLRPGFAFGGSCLPKDLRAMINQSKRGGYTPHLLESTLRVNESQKEKAVSLIRMMVGPDIENRTIAIIGAAYKENTDDIRESPAVYLIQELIKGKAKIKVYDPLALDNLQAHFEDRILCSASLEEILTGVDLCVVALNYVRSDELGSLINLMSAKNILDLVGIAAYSELRKRSDVNYVAISW